jgi:small-conductance mechanosensitive channel
MWPKALAQLIELAPHLARLLPMADRFLQSKSSDLEASRTALEQMSAGLRGDLGQVTASHAGLYRQLNDQSEKLSTLAEDQRAMKQSLDAVDARLTTLEPQLRILRTLLVIATLLLVLVVVLVSLKLHR